MNPIQSQAMNELQARTFTTNECIKINWLKSEAHKIIADSTIYKVLGDPSIALKQIIMAGGAFVSMFFNQTPRDIDIFLLNMTEPLSPKVGTWYGIESITASPPGSYAGNRNFIESFMVGKMNYVVTSYKTREELIADFDYAHCCVSFDLAKDLLYISRETYNAIRDKVLIVNNDKNLKPHREEKFIGRGFLPPIIQTVTVPYVPSPFNSHP